MDPLFRQARIPNGRTKVNYMLLIKSKTMRIRSISLSFLLLSLFISGCTSMASLQSENDPIKSDYEVVPLNLEGSETRVTISSDGGTLMWSANDQVSVYQIGVEGISNPGFHNYAVSNDEIVVDVANFGAREGYSVYPAGDHSYNDSQLTINLPAEYDISNSLGASASASYSPVVLVSQNAADSPMKFYQVGAVMRLTVNSIPAGTKKVVVDFGKRIIGRFILRGSTLGVDAVISSDDSASDLTSVSFKVSSSGLSSETNNVVLTIPVPTGSYSSLSVSAMDESNILASYSDDTERTFNRKGGKRKTIALTAVPSSRDFLFSVSDTKQVVFSPAGLLFDGVNWTFLDSQVDGYSNGESTWEENGKRDMFYYVDASASREIQGYTWYNLSKTEWDYLINSRASGALVNGVNDARYLKVRLDYITLSNGFGLLLFPDGFIWPEALTDLDNRLASLDNNPVNKKNSVRVSISSDEFSALEEAGCVFLLARGVRSNIGMWGETTSYDYGATQRYGAYWTRTSGVALYYTEYTACGFLSDQKLKTSFPVRLVRDN